MKILRLKPGGRGFEIRANNFVNSKQGIHF